MRVIITINYSNKHKSFHPKLRIFPALHVKDIQGKTVGNGPLHMPSVPDLARRLEKDSSRKAPPLFL